MGNMKVRQFGLYLTFSGSIVCTIIFISGMCCFPEVIFASNCKFIQLVDEWKGKYPVTGKKNIIKTSELSDGLKLVLDDKYITRLSNLEAEPYYLIQPIKYVAGCLVLTYLPNAHYNEDDIGITIVIDTSTCALHAALHLEDGRVIWRHSGGSPVPASVLKLFISN